MCAGMAGCGVTHFQHLASVVSSYSFSDDMSAHVCMTPMADLLNHSTFRNNARLYYADDALEVCASV
jgi:hypothetical protein